jgi:hypothetical protein
VLRHCAAEVSKLRKPKYRGGARPTIVAKVQLPPVDGLETVVAAGLASSAVAAPQEDEVVASIVVVAVMVIVGAGAGDVCVAARPMPTGPVKPVCEAVMVFVAVTVVVWILMEMGCELHMSAVEDRPVESVRVVDEEGEEEEEEEEEKEEDVDVLLVGFALAVVVCEDADVDAVCVEINVAELLNMWLDDMHLLGCERIDIVGEVDTADVKWCEVAVVGELVDVLVDELLVEGCMVVDEPLDATSEEEDVDDTCFVLCVVVELEALAGDDVDVVESRANDVVDVIKSCDEVVVTERVAVDIVVGMAWTILELIDDEAK